jgi:hypothetical protein
MTQFPRITIRLSADFERERGPERFSGVLIEPGIAAYLVDGEELAFLGVVETDVPGEYRQTTGHTFVGYTDDEADIPRIVDKLRSMTGWDFFLRYLVRGDITDGIDFVTDFTR